MIPLELDQAAEKHSTHKTSPVGSILYIHKKSAFLAGADWQKEQYEWISVEHKLPEFNEYVLVYNTEGATLIGRLMKNGWIALFSDGEHFMDELTATHWKNLPPPPKN